MPRHSWCVASPKALRRACRMPSGGCGPATGDPGHRGRGGVPRPARFDRHPPGRPRPTPRRCRRHRPPRAPGARARPRRRPSRPWSGIGAPRPRGVGERRSRRCVPRIRRRHGEPGDGWIPARMWSAASIALADIRIAQGRLNEAMRIYERGLAARDPSRGPDPSRRGGHARRHRRHPPRAKRPRWGTGTTC